MMLTLVEHFAATGEMFNKNVIAVITLLLSVISIPICVTANS